MPGTAFLRGDRVVLRTIEEEDIEILQRSRNEPAFREGLMSIYPQNRITVETDLEERSEEVDEDTLGLLICADKEAVGLVILFDIHRGETGTLGYWLLPEHQGEGYATEGVGLLIDHAFQNLALHRILGWTIDYNEESQAVLRRLGFSHEGTYREHIFRKGEYHDTEHYGLLVSEWEDHDVSN
jgi:RimJ/RimL family protein N-acetyltransferase